MSAAKTVWAVIRPSEDRLVDDVAISGDLFRMEQMDQGSWWLAIYRGDKRVAFSLRWDAQKRDIIASVIEDDFGCHNDSTAVYEGEK